MNDRHEHAKAMIKEFKEKYPKATDETLKDLYQLYREECSETGISHALTSLKFDLDDYSGELI